MAVAVPYIFVENEKGKWYNRIINRDFRDIREPVINKILRGIQICQGKYEHLQKRL